MSVFADIVWSISQWNRSVESWLYCIFSHNPHLLGYAKISTFIFAFLPFLPFVLVLVVETIEVFIYGLEPSAVCLMIE